MNQNLSVPVEDREASVPPFEPLFRTESPFRNVSLSASTASQYQYQHVLPAHRNAEASAERNAEGDVFECAGSPVDAVGSPLSQTVRKKRVYIRDSETQARLVKQCIVHFSEYIKGPKKKYWDDMRSEFRSTTGLDVVVGGLMKSWADDRRRQNAEDRKKSGVARSSNDLEQALDRWISLIDDVERSREEEKKTDEEKERKKKTSSRLRKNMSETLARKRALSLDTDSDTENTNPKRLSGSSRPDGPRTTRTRGAEKLIETLTASTKEGDERMMKHMSEVENRKMERLEQIAKGMKTPGLDSEVKGEVDKLREDMGRMNETVQGLQSGIGEMLQMMKRLEERNNS